jgi:hypothetical protein
MEKIKGFMDSNRGKDILTVIIVILVGLGSFELGRLSKMNSDAGIKIVPSPMIGSQVSNQSANVVSAVIATPSPTPKVTTPTTPAKVNYFFASNRGSKYYPMGCSAGKNIKQENRVYFTSASEAEKAGYELSSSCK